jgi:hypothetical protein
MSKDRYALFTDFVQGAVVATKHFDRYDEGSPTGQSLLVKIAATHSALRTGNKGFYLPEMMRAGAPSFLVPYKKPVLTHHDDFNDPIGRVQSARYVDLSYRYPVNDIWLNKLAAGSLKDKDLQKAVQYILKEWQNQEEYQGLGYVELIAEITDPDAIQKILDNRYLTVSTAHSSDAAFCGICMKNWVTDGWCEHEPGETYEDEECVLIPGKHLYSEVSYVNKPADRQAMNVAIVEGQPNTMDMDFEPRTVDMKLFCKGPACIFDMANDAQISLKDAEGPLEEVIDSMSEKTKEQETLDLLKVTLEDTSKDLPEELVKDEESLKLAHSLLTINCCDDEEPAKFDGKAELSKKLRDKAGEMEIELEDNEVELQVKADEKAAADDDPTANADGQTDGDSDETNQDADKELLDLKDILDFEKSYEKMKEHLSEDKHLNEETLGLLRASDFALPKERAFPCPDCDHIDAALKVLEGYEAPGIKDAVVASLERKKVSMKCAAHPADCPKGQHMVKGKCVPMEDEEDMDMIPMDQINDFIDAYAEALEGEDELFEVTDETEDLLDDEDAAKKRPQDKPGGSNVGKYKTGPFCGPAGGAPKGSYPVNTKKRAIAALSYARHAPNPAGVKSCVCKHWSSLSACGSKKKDAEELKTEIDMLKGQLAEMDVELECPGCTEVTAQVEAQDAQIEVQQDQLTVFEDDYRVLSEENVQLTTELTNRLADRAMELRILNGENIEDMEVTRDEFMTHSIAEMRDSVSTLEDAFDVDKAAERLNDGMAKDPEGTVKDPTVLTDGGEAESQGQAPTKEEVMNTFNRIHARSGVKVARQWLDEMKTKHGEHLELEDNNEEDNK